MWPRLKLEAAACIRSEVLEDDGASLVLFTAVIWLFAVFGLTVKELSCIV